MLDLTKIGIVSIKKCEKINKQIKETKKFLERTLQELEKRDIFYFCWWLVKLKVTWIIPTPGHVFTGKGNK